MKLTTRSEYACLALLELTKTYGKGYSAIKTIAKKGGIPEKYLELILLTLKRSGYLLSKRGLKGGYKLAKNPSKINVAEIIRIMDGPIAPVKSVSKHFREPTPIEKSPRLTSLFSEIREMVACKLENTTLMDLVEET